MGIFSSLALILLTQALACCLAGDYAPLEQTGSACHWRHSCASPDMSRDFRERNCECDRLCGSYGDCCIDSPQSGPFRNNMRQCMAYGTVRNVGAYVISACPAGRSSERCRQRNTSDPLLASPVTTPGGATYYNAHCAECNGADLARLVRWTPLLACDSLAHHNLSRDYILNGLERNGSDWGVVFQGKFHTCVVLFDKPQSVSNLRLCRAQVVSSCPRGREGEGSVLCEAYEAVVYTSNFVAYRNPHCAFCNGVGENDTLFCDPDEIVSGRVRFSYALVFDVGAHGGDLVGVKQEPSCPDDYKYDGFTKTCRNLICAVPGYRLVGDKCVKNND